jgi:hypothetical protein
VGTAAVVVALVIGTGVVFLIEKGSSPPTWLLLEKNVADCHSGASLTGPPCALETMSLSGGSTRAIPIDPDANQLLYQQANYYAVGHHVLVVPIGPDTLNTNLASPQLPVTMGVTGLDVLDLRTGAWTQVSLSEASTINAGTSDFTGEMMLDPAEDAVAIDTGKGSDIAIVSLATGSVRQLSPSVANVDLIVWLSDGVHVVADCPGASSWGSTGTGPCGYAVDPSSGAASRRPAEDVTDTGRWPQIVASPDGTHEAVVPVSSGSDVPSREVLAGTAGSSLRTVYTGPSGDFSSVLAVGDGGSVLVGLLFHSAEGPTGLGLKELLVASGNLTTVATPAGGWGDGSAASCAWGAASSVDSPFSLPAGGFVEEGPSGRVVRVSPDGSTTTIATVPAPQTTALCGLVW